MSIFDPTDVPPPRPPVLTKEVADEHVGHPDQPRRRRRNQASAEHRPAKADTKTRRHEEKLAAAGPKAKNKDLPWYKREFNILSPVKADDVMNFSRQAASFLRAGIPILDALATIAEDNTNKHMTEVLNEIADSLRTGGGFAPALARYPRIFPGYYTAMVRSAELTGRLDDVLDQLAEYIERDLDTRRKVKSALTYPAVIVTMSIGAVLILALFVLPRFADLFDSLDAKLPLATRMLLAVTNFFTAWWWAVLIGLGLIAAGLFALYGGKQGKSRRDALLLRAPAVGTLVHFASIERFCRVLSALVRSGVALPDALMVASDSTNNHVFMEHLGEARERMIRGEGLAGPLGETGLFPAAARQMIRVGESTGTLDAQLESAANYYGQELEYRIKRFTDLFEPLVIVGVGAVVGFIAIALVSAMYGVFDQIQT